MLLRKQNQSSLFFCLFFSLSCQRRAQKLREEKNTLTGKHNECLLAMKGPIGITECRAADVTKKIPTQTLNPNTLYLEVWIIFLILSSNTFRSMSYSDYKVKSVKLWRKGVESQMKWCYLVVFCHLSKVHFQRLHIVRQMSEKTIETLIKCKKVPMS